MKILIKKELRDYPHKELVNIRAYTKNNQKNKTLSSQEEKKLLNQLDTLYLKHHQAPDFNKNFEILFSKMDKGFFDVTERMIVQSLDRANMGSHFVGIVLDSNLHFFAESAEMGINILVHPNEMNKSALMEIINTIDWFIEALNDAEKALKEIEISNLKNYFNDELEEKEIKTNKIKL